MSIVAAAVVALRLEMLMAEFLARLIETGEPDE